MRRMRKAGVAGLGCRGGLQASRGLGMEVEEG